MGTRRCFLVTSLIFCLTVIKGMQGQIPTNTQISSSLLSTGFTDQNATIAGPPPPRLPPEIFSRLNACATVQTVAVSMKIQQDFTADLSNRSSQAFETLRAKIHAAVLAAYSSSGHFVAGMEVQSFANGSVIANYSILAGTNGTLSTNGLAAVVMDASSIGRFGELTVEAARTFAISQTVNVSQFAPLMPFLSRPSLSPALLDSLKNFSRSMFLDVTMKIQDNFTDDLKNLSSPKSLQMKQLIFDNVKKIYQGSPFQPLDLWINEFKSGSIDANYTAVLGTNDTTEANATEVLTNSTSTGSFGNLTVDTNLTVSSEPLPTNLTNLTSTTAGILSSTTPVSIGTGSTTTPISTASASSTTTGSTVSASSTTTGSTVSPSSTTTGSTVPASSTTTGSTVPSSSTTTGSTVSPSSTTTGSTVSTSSTTTHSTVSPSSTTTHSTVSPSSTTTGSTVTGSTSTTTTGSTVTSTGSTATTSNSTATTLSGAQTMSTSNVTGSSGSTASTNNVTSTTTPRTTTRTTTTIRTNTTSGTTTTPVPTFPPLTRDGVNQCKQMGTDPLLGSCVFFMAMSMTPPNDTTLVLLKNGATYYMSQDDPDENDARNYILGLDMDQANIAMMSATAVLTAQRVRAAMKNSYLTQAGDMGSGIGDTVSDMATGYLQQMNIAFDRDAAAAILLLFEKQLTARTFNVALRNMPPLYARPVTINLQILFTEDYNNLTSPKSMELIRDVTDAFGKRLELNRGSQYAFVVISLTRGSVEVNAEVTYDMMNPNGTDPIDAIGESFEKDPTLGNFTINPDRSNFGNDPSFEQKLMSNKGQDHKMIVSVTVPAFAGIFIMVVVILCCTSMANKPTKKSQNIA